VSSRQRRGAWRRADLPSPPHPPSPPSPLPSSAWSSSATLRRNGAGELDPSQLALAVESRGSEREGPAEREKGRAGSSAPPLCTTGGRKAAGVELGREAVSVDLGRKATVGAELGRGSAPVWGIVGERVRRAREIGEGRETEARRRERHRRGRVKGPLLFLCSHAWKTGQTANGVSTA
jgi:hypothetical protein